MRASSLRSFFFAAQMISGKASAHAACVCVGGPRATRPAPSPKMGGLVLQSGSDWSSTPPPAPRGVVLGNCQFVGARAKAEPTASRRATEKTSRQAAEQPSSVKLRARRARGGERRGGGGSANAKHRKCRIVKKHARSPIKFLGYPTSCSPMCVSDAFLRLGNSQPEPAACSRPLKASSVSPVRVRFPSLCPAKRFVRFGVLGFYRLSNLPLRSGRRPTLPRLGRGARERPAPRARWRRALGSAIAACFRIRQFGRVV